MKLFLILFILARWHPEYAQIDIETQQWFLHLHNKQGAYCCADADGYKPTDQDIIWDTKDQKYRVKINGEWVTVEDYQKLDEPNKVGRAMVWITPDKKIRCFLPGAEN